MSRFCHEHWQLKVRNEVTWVMKYIWNYCNCGKKQGRCFITLLCRRKLKVVISIVGNAYLLCVCLCVCMYVGECLLGATSVYTARGSLVASQSLQRNWPRPPALYNNRKGNGLPKASSFRLIVLPASAQSCHETISSIYQPYIHHQC